MRQRIGMAKTLLHSPDVLILDEPNASLDKEGERALISSLTHLKSRGVTIVMVAHRINTLRPCETVYRLERGKIVRQGTFEEMFAEEKAEPEVATNVEN